MFLAISGCFSLLVLISSTFSRAASNNTKGTPVPTASNCHNVYNYNSFSAEPNKEVKNLLQEMKTKLAEIEKKIEAITGHKTTDGGKTVKRYLIRSFFRFLSGSGKLNCYKRGKCRTPCEGNQTIHVAFIKHLKTYLSYHFQK